MCCLSAISLFLPRPFLIFSLFQKEKKREEKKRKKRTVGGGGNHANNHHQSYAMMDWKSRRWNRLHFVDFFGNILPFLGPNVKRLIRRIDPFLIYISAALLPYTVDADEWPSTDETKKSRSTSISIHFSLFFFWLLLDKPKKVKIIHVWPAHNFNKRNVFRFRQSDATHNRIEMKQLANIYEDEDEDER